MLPSGFTRNEPLLRDFPIAQAEIEQVQNFEFNLVQRLGQGAWRRQLASGRSDQQALTGCARAALRFRTWSLPKILFIRHFVVPIDIVSSLAIS